MRACRYGMSVFAIECRLRNALVPKKRGWQYTSGPDLVPGPPPGRCNPLQSARAGALRAGGLGRPARAWRDEGRAPGSGLYQERIPRRHLRVLGRPDAAIPCITSPLKWFSCGVDGSGRQPIQSAEQEARGWWRVGQQETMCSKLGVRKEGLKTIV